MVAFVEPGGHRAMLAELADGMFDGVALFVGGRVAGGWPASPTSTQARPNTRDWCRRTNAVAAPTAAASPAGSAPSDSPSGSDSCGAVTLIHVLRAPPLHAAASGASLTRTDEDDARTGPRPISASPALAEDSDFGAAQSKRGPGSYISVPGSSSSSRADAPKPHRGPACQECAVPGCLPGDGRVRRAKGA